MHLVHTTPEHTIGARTSGGSHLAHAKLAHLLDVPELLIPREDGEDFFDNGADQEEKRE
jgi:hypothetical protein